MKRRAFLGLFVFKLALTAFAAWFVVTRVDLSDAISTLSRIDLLFVSAAVICALAQIWLASERFVFVTGMVGSRVRQGDAMRITFIGAFFSQAFATFVSGDLMRVWLLARHGPGYRASAAAVLIDRVFGIAALMVLILVGSPLLFDVLPSLDMRASVAAVTAAFIGMIGGFIALGWLLEPARRRWPLLSSPRFAWLADFAGAARYVLAAPAKTVCALLLGLAVHLLSVASIYLLFRGLGTTVAAVSCFLFVPFVMLIAMLPLSFAGWGLREGAMVAAFGTAGVASEVTLVVSITFGLVILAVSLPGLALWLTGAARMPITPPANEALSTSQAEL